MDTPMTMETPHWDIETKAHFQHPDDDQQGGSRLLAIILHRTSDANLNDQPVDKLLYL